MRKGAGVVLLCQLFALAAVGTAGAAPSTAPLTLAGILDTTDGVADTTGGLLDGATGPVADTIGGAVDTTGGLLDGATGTVGDTTGGLLDGATGTVGDTTEGLLDGATGAAGDTAEGLIDTTDGTLDSVGGVLDGGGSGGGGSDGGGGSVSAPIGGSTSDGGNGNGDATGDAAGGGGGADRRTQRDKKRGAASSRRAASNARRRALNALAAADAARAVLAGGPSIAAPAAAAAAAGGAGDADGPLTLSELGRRLDFFPAQVPDWSRPIILALLLLAFGLGVRSRIATARARRLDHQRNELLNEVGMLQRALLPDVPDRVGGIDVSVAYRPAAGLAAGGDFYDVFPLDGGRVGLLMGDVSGHGRDAVGRAATMRHTLRAYLEAGCEPRTALRVAGQAHGGGEDDHFATAIVAVHDPAADTLTYACAGHEPPLLFGAPEHEPVTACASPAIGWGMATGQRQTTVALPPGAAALLFTDGLTEARAGDDLLGRAGLALLARDAAPDAGADGLLASIEATADRVGDDMAACVLRASGTPAAAPAAAPVRIEELELEPFDVRTPRLGRFLEACGVDDAGMAERLAAAVVEEAGGAVVRVTVGPDGPVVDVEPRSFTAAELGLPAPAGVVAGRSAPGESGAAVGAAAGA